MGTMVNCALDDDSDGARRTQQQPKCVSFDWVKKEVHQFLGMNQQQDMPLTPPPIPLHSWLYDEQQLTMVVKTVESLIKFATENPQCNISIVGSVFAPHIIDTTGKLFWNNTLDRTMNVFAMPGSVKQLTVSIVFSFVLSTIICRVAGNIG